MVSQLTLTELHRELQRRVDKLKQQKHELLEKIESIDSELAAIDRHGLAGASDAAGPSRGSGGRRKNRVPLTTVLAGILYRVGPLTAREASEAALANGYETTSKNFKNTVGVALHRDDRFEKTDGKWHLTDEARATLEAEGMSDEVDDDTSDDDGDEPSDERSNDGSANGSTGSVASSLSHYSGE